MPAVATNIKFTQAERILIADLGKLWGTSSRPLPMAEVVRRAIDSAHKAEMPKPSKQPKEKRA
jgi:hypothetical protein